MADSIVRLKVESQEYDAKLKRAAEGLQRYADGCRKVGGTLEVVEKETLDFVKAIGNMETTSKSATGKLSEMKKTFTELSVEYKKLTDQEKQSPFGKALAESLDQLKVRIKDSKDELDDINKSINGGGGLSGALDTLAGKFGLNIEQLTKFGGVAAVATTALEVAKDAFFESEQNIDEWGRTIEGAKGAYNIFLDTLNNGNWSGFFQNLQTAIKGSRDLYDALDRLGSVKSNNAAAIAIVQQQIAQLRLAKQNGQDVDAQIKEATAKLAALQKQSVNAGKTAGSKSAFSVIRNGVNSVGNVGLNDATINYAVDLIMKNGQSEFDKYKRNRDVLYQRGLVTKTETINDSQGGTYERQYKVFDLNALSREQQKQYALAQAITEGETRIQEGISIFAQAVQEGTSSAREEFKGNRYSLQGSGGGGRSGSGGGKGGGGVVDIVDKDDFSEMEEIVGLIALQRQKVKDLQEQIEHAPDETFITYMRGELQVAQEELDRLTGKTKTTGEAITQDLSAPLLQMSSILKQLNDELAHAETPEAYQNILADIKAINQEMENFKGNTGVTELNKSGKNADKSWRDASSAVQSVGSALQQIEDPSAKIAGLIGQAIANIALGFAQATASDSKLGVFGWIAAIAGGLATMTSTIAAIHSATGFQNGGIVQGAPKKYATGGIIQGNTYSSDMIPIRANAGELILNRAQQGNIASQLEGTASQNLRLYTDVSGRNLRIIMDNDSMSRGKGKFVTSNNR